MTASELKYLTRETSPYFLTRETMKFFGDTMRNYGVRSAVIETRAGKNVDVWELYRKSSVKHGLSKSSYFNKDTYEQEFIESEV